MGQAAANAGQTPAAAGSGGGGTGRPAQTVAGVGGRTRRKVGVRGLKELWEGRVCRGRGWPLWSVKERGGGVGWGLIARGGQARGSVHVKQGGGRELQMRCGMRGKHRRSRWADGHCVGWPLRVIVCFLFRVV